MNSAKGRLKSSKVIASNDDKRMKRNIFQPLTCGSVDHRIHRRMFLQGLATGATSLMSFGGLFSMPAFAQQVKQEQKHCILLWLCGAPSQFETWDPKPGTPYGGPFKSIPTKVPGVHISELMPKCANILDKLAIVRSM